MNSFFKNTDEEELRQQVFTLLNTGNRALLLVSDRLRIISMTDGARVLLRVDVLDTLVDLLSDQCIETLRECSEKRACASVRELIDEKACRLDVRTLADGRLVLYFETEEATQVPKPLFDTVSQSIDMALCNIMMATSRIANEQEPTDYKARARTIRVNGLRMHRALKHANRLMEETAYAIANLHTCDAAEICRELVARATPHCPKEITIETDLPDKLPAVLDGALMLEALSNLLVNALSAPHATRVELSLRHKGKRLLFCVSDNGAGLAPETLATFFSGWCSAQPARDRLEELCAERAWGLGLPVAFRIAGMHSGTLFIQPCGEMGTELVLSMPDNLDPLSTMRQRQPAVDDGFDLVETEFSPLL